MIKNISLLCTILIASSIVKSQQLSPVVFPAGGSYFSNQTIDMSVTIGESLTDTYVSPGLIQTQGFAQPSLINIDGHVIYDNVQNSPLRNSLIYLKLNNQPFRTTRADSTGYFYFADLLPGNYKLDAVSAIPWGGVNTADALIVLKHFTELITLTGLRLQAADVNNSGNINTVDALAIAKRYVEMIQSFNISDWLFEHPILTVNNHSNYVINIKGLCAGDLNGSYIP
jgi:hypothetical protein